jgi:hypothetical protein
VVEAANNFFTALQKQFGWFDQTNDTKTAYAKAWLNYQRRYHTSTSFSPVHFKGTNYGIS